MRFEQRVGLAAALAIAEVDLLVVQRADFGVHVAAAPAVVLGAWCGYFLLDYLALCMLSAVAAWMRGLRPAGARPAAQAARRKSTSRTASRPDTSCVARTRRAPAGKIVPPPNA